ncbi:hypothetical protein B5F40_04635 [Gordonibacter sp. An230]|nr:hypothetical protein B5F40_04635 [Gordonibacter sp. An230]
MWSKAGLGLKLGSVELCLYARIYAFSRRGAGVYYETQEAAAHAFEVSVRQVQRAIKSLSESGLVVEVGRYRLGNNRDSRRFKVSQARIDEAVRSFDAEAAARALSGDGMSREALPDETSPDRRTERRASGDGMSGEAAARATECRSERMEGSCGSNGHPSKPSPAETRRAVGEKAAEAVERLMEASINRRASFEEVAAAYARALARGYSPETIEEGYRRYTARYRRDNPETARYAMRLDNWLSRPDGLSFDLPPKRSRGKRPSPEEERRAERERFERALMDRNPEYRELKELVGRLYPEMGWEKLRGSAEKASRLEDEIKRASARMEEIETEGIGA